MPSNPLTQLTEGLPQDQIRKFAWLGDAQLALFVRVKIIELKGQIDTQSFIAATSNEFLSSLGPPTRIEAQIGILRDRQGEAAAIAFIEQEIWPKALKKIK